MLEIEVVDGVIKAVVTSQGRIDCSVVVCCAGQWTRSLAATVGVNVPLVSVQHQYVITAPFDPPVPRDLPTLRDPDRLTYYKEEVGGLVMGGYEPNPIPWANDGIPHDFNFKLLDADFDHFAPTMELAMGRVPGAADRRHQRVDQRSRELHPRRQLHPRRGTGAEELLRRRRLQRLRHRGRWRRRHGAGRVGASRRCAVRPVGRRHPPLRPPAPGHRLGAHTHARGVRQALHHGLAVRGARQRPPVPHRRRCTRGCSTRARASARSSAGSGPTGSPAPITARPHTTSTATSGRTGSRPSDASIALPARRRC